MIRLYQFIRRQVSEVKAGGGVVFLRKAQFSIEIILRFITLPLALIIVAIRPLILIRFGTLRSDRLGHFTGDVEAFLCARSIEIENYRTVDVIGCPEPVCNRQLQAMWARVMCITPGARLWAILDLTCHQITRSDLHHIKLAGRAVQMGLFSTTKRHISFTYEEDRRGQELLKQLGIPAGVPWVCIHNRDSAYLAESQPTVNWGYHDYRDFSVQTMASAAEELTQRGYYVLRMGSIVAESFMANHPKIIDYSNHSARSDFADIYLLGNCAFYLGSDSGIVGVPAIFRKPFAFVNFPAAQTIYSVYYWNPMPFTLKRAWLKKEARWLSLREHFVNGLANADHTQAFEAAGIELVNNTPEEIRDLAAEVDDRIAGVWQTTREDEELQQRFWEIVRQYVPTYGDGEFKARIGAAFLRKHVDLLN